MSVINPPIDDLLSKVDSKYTLCIIAAKRARQINDYYRNLGENTMGIEDTLTPPLINTRSTNLLTIAFEEIVDNKIEYKTPE
jgi:DNA-directed RNA polymerase subunit omega